jgi:hypothetical protein
VAMGHLAGASLAKRSQGVQHIDKPAVDEAKPWAVVASEHGEFRSTRYPHPEAPGDLAPPKRSLGFAKARAGPRRVCCNKLTSILRDASRLPRLKAGAHLSMRVLVPEGRFEASPAQGRGRTSA